ncbi:hypothetical protein [Burkholderia lata]|uniref:OspG family effector kinase n=1 Tax=Burkholderia lata (strain ATCC 17760 / DSM 23089 / LMG 22485 / NCIMB 9086 / R18194 / 383) TaxID=482957 RepID=UPI00399BD327
MPRTERAGDSGKFSIPRVRLSNQFVKMKEAWSQRGATISKATDSSCSMSRGGQGESRESNHNQVIGSFSFSTLSPSILSGSNILNIDELRESRSKKKVCFSADVEVFYIPRDISERSWQTSSVGRPGESGMNGTLGWLGSPPKRNVRFSNDVEVFRIPRDSLDGSQKISQVGYDGLLGVAGILGRQVGEGGEALIFEKRGDKNRLIKLFKRSIAEDEMDRKIEGFSRFYGPGSVRKISEVAFEMKRIPGIPLFKLDRLPFGSADQFCGLVKSMDERGCVVDDFSEGNFIYNVASQEMFPVDLIAMDNRDSLTKVDVSGIRSMVNFISRRMGVSPEPQCT